MERARLSSADMHQAVTFIDAALALDEARQRGGALNSASETARLALEIAAVIYYARPFTNNTRQKKKSKRPPPAGAPPLGKVDIGPLSEALASREARALHRDVLNIRNKVVAHAEARYFPVRMVKAFLPEGSGRLGDFALKSGQRFPKLNLTRLRWNAKQLAAVFSIHAHCAAEEVRATRKRLHRK